MAGPEKKSAGKSDGPRKPLCFVVGPIGKDGSEERKHSDLLLNAVIREVLEREEFGYAVKRADEDADPGMIGDRVITDIIHAELVVADLTGLNPNAFYELGIRHATELPTIHVAKEGTPLPFDNAGHRAIFVDLTEWNSIVRARGRLVDTARAIKGADFKVSNPITQANASFKMRTSEDPRDRLIATLQERLEALESRTDLMSTLRSRKGMSEALALFEQVKQRALTLAQLGVKAEEAAEQLVAIADAENAPLQVVVRDDSLTVRLASVGGFQVNFDPKVWPRT